MSFILSVLYQDLFTLFCVREANFSAVDLPARLPTKPLSTNYIPHPLKANPKPAPKSNPVSFVSTATQEAHRKTSTVRKAKLNPKPPGSANPPALPPSPLNKNKRPLERCQAKRL